MLGQRRGTISVNDNLLSLFQQWLGAGFSRELGDLLDESQGSAQSALASLLPVVLGGMVRKGATPRGAASLMALVNGTDLDIGAPGDLAGLFDGGGFGAGVLMESGGGLAQPLFGDKFDALANALAASSGMKGSSAGDLLALVVPLGLAFLKTIIAQRGLNAETLSSLLCSQVPHLTHALDRRLTGALGFAEPAAFLTTPGGQGSAAATPRAAGGAVRPAKADDSAGQSRWMPLVIAAALVFLVWNLFFGEPSEPPVADTVATAPLFEPEPAGDASALPATIYFDIGSATADADGHSTLVAVARTINREGLSVTVTGYADAAGDPAANEDLARSRAAFVVDTLRTEGVADSAIAVMPTAFVEGGAGEAGDAQARRVDIDVQ